MVTVEALLILLGIGTSRTAFLNGDASDYNQYALNLVRHGVLSEALSAPFHPGVSRAPGYPALLALLHLVAMNSVLLVRIVQFGLVAVIACLVYGIALPIADSRSARFSALVTATYLPLLWYATHALTEVLACLLATLLVFILIRAIKRHSAWLWVAAGLTLAVGTYIRPEFAGLGVVIALVVLLTGQGSYLSRTRWLSPAIIVAVIALALAPWIVRNASVADSFVPVDTQLGGAVLASADQYAGKASSEFTQADFQRYVVQVNTITAKVEPKDPTAAQQVAADRALTHRALSIVGQLSVGTILKTVPRRLAYLWGPADVYPVGKSWSGFAHRLGQFQYVLLVVLILAGMTVRRRKLIREWPLWIIAAYLTILHLISDGEPRYTLPARPALFAYTGVAVSFIAARVGNVWRTRQTASSEVSATATQRRASVVRSWRRGK